MVLNANISDKSCIFKNCQSMESISKLLKEDEFQNFQNEINNDYNEYYNDIIEEGKDLFINNNIDYFSSFNNEIDKFLSSISVISKKEDDNSDNYTILFSNGESKYLKDNLTILRESFYNCKSLTIIPDISDWKTKNVIDMSFMFYNCEKLLSLPDISKWETNNVLDMNHMFANSKLLTTKNIL